MSLVRVEKTSAFVAELNALCEFHICFGTNRNRFGAKNNMRDADQNNNAFNILHTY